MNFTIYSKFKKLIYKISNFDLDPPGGQNEKSGAFHNIPGFA